MQAALASPVSTLLCRTTILSMSVHSIYTFVTVRVNCKTFFWIHLYQTPDLLFGFFTLGFQNGCWSGAHVIQINSPDDLWLIPRK